MAILTADCIADTYIRLDNPTSNFGSVSNLSSGGLISQSRKALLRFSRPELPDVGSVITGAVLRLFQSQGNLFGGTVNWMLKGWVETEVTWNIYATGSNWALPGMLAGTDYDILIGDSFATSDAIGEYVEYDVPTVVQEAYNQSADIDIAVFMAIGGPAGSTFFQARSESNPPEIVITTDDPPTPTRRIRTDKLTDFDDKLDLHLEIKNRELPRWYRRLLTTDKANRISNMRKRGIWSLPYTRKARRP